MKTGTSTHDGAEEKKNVNVGDIFHGYEVLRPMRAIRAKCLDCCGDNSAEVRRCVIPSCPLYPFRMGRRAKVWE